MPADDRPSLKSQIASIGIHIRQRLTTHGFALNLTADPLRWFAHITACGLPSIRATALSEFLLPTAMEESATPCRPASSSSAAAQAAEETTAITYPAGSAETVYAESTALLADRFGAEFGQAGAWEPLDLDGPVGRLVRALELESAKDGEKWLAEPRTDDESEGTR